MIGVAELGPGNGNTHAMFSVWLQTEGRFTSFVEPLKNGPRHCGQSMAMPGTAEIRTKTMIGIMYLEVFIYMLLSPLFHL